MKAGAATVLSIIALAVTPLASAQQSHHIGTNLSGYEETPSTLSTPGKGQFDARIREGDETSINYELSYSDTEGAVTQAHIHFGQRALSGGISAWLCGNATPPGVTPAIVPPPGTPLCPPAPATVTGTITAEDVVGPTGQGIAPGEIEELVRAIRAGAAYANVHTTKYPGGEIRGQFDVGHRH